MDAFTLLAAQQARRLRKLRRVHGPGYAHLCFTDDYRKIPRGTVIDRQGVVWGYPHIGWILSLEARRLPRRACSSAIFSPRSIRIRTSSIKSYSSARAL